MNCGWKAVSGRLSRLEGCEGAIRTGGSQWSEQDELEGTRGGGVVGIDSGIGFVGAKEREE